MSDPGTTDKKETEGESQPNEGEGNRTAARRYNEGVERTDATHIIQLPGDALVMPIKSFREHLADAAFREPVSSYVAKTLSIVAQSSACIAFHPVQERLARWLLMVQDCTERDKFALTQDFIAVMLGVYRPTVTLAMHALENAGLIHSTRGLIEIADRLGLEKASCECFALRRWNRANPFVMAAKS